jgi:hypothetical protein
MRNFLTVCLAFTMAGCAYEGSQKNEGSSFFPLPDVVGRVEVEVVRLPPFPGPSDAWIGIVATMPEARKGWTVLFRFKSDRDPNYRLLAANRGRLFRVVAKDGQGIFSRSEIVFVSDHTPVFTLLKEEAQPKVK